ncbi:alpha/beta hydrolase [Candidatus Woesearchaeota archaeon]|nr:alpha/beta hydrolase [Candidatus Woesearchaeota archaeon]
MKKVIMIHGWDGYPENCWFPWLKRGLESRGFEVIVPAMPDPSIPMPEPWVEKIKEAVGEPDEDTFLVGHSIGCMAIMKYLESIDVKIGGAILVAGWLTLTNYEERDEEEKHVVEDWTKKELGYDKIKMNAREFIAIFSDDDPEVPLDNSKVFKDKLGAKIIIEKGKGHFSDDAGVKELPVVLNELLDISE